MKVSKKIGLVLVYASIVLSFSACGGSGGTEESVARAVDNTLHTEASSSVNNKSDWVGKEENVNPVSESSENEGCLRGEARLTGRIFEYSGGRPISGATVTVRGCSVKTDENGYYTIDGVAETDRAVVTIKADGFYDNSVIVSLKRYVNGTQESSPNYLAYPLDKYDLVETISGEDNEAFEIRGGALVEIEAGGYVGQNGELYEGMVEVRLAYENIFTSKGRFEFPGEYQGIDANGEKRLFASYGMIVVDLKDNEGNDLDVLHPIVVEFPAVSDLKAEIVPMWYYDYNDGMWVEKGYATRQDDGSYRGEIDQTGTWSLNVPVEDTPGIYKGRILYEDGTPARGIRIQARGDNWIETDLSTDENGWFEIEVVPNSDFTIRAYDYVKKFEAVFKEVISGIESGETFEDKR